MEKIIITRDGPLLAKKEQTGIALNWYGLKASNNSIEAILYLNKARNWTEFTKALGKYRGSPQAFLFSDTAGNIGKYIATHNKHFAELIPVKTEKIDDDNLQNSLSNFIIASEGSIYPTNGIENSLALLSSGTTWAALRAKSILGKNQSQKTKFNLEDMIALQADTKAPLSELMIKTINNALESLKNNDQYQNEALIALSHWDGQLKKNSNPTSIYEFFITYLTRKLLQEKIGEQLTNDYINKWPYWTKFTVQLLNSQSSSLLPASEGSFSLFYNNCFSATLKNLRLVFRTNQVTNNLSSIEWQKLHQVDFRSILSRFVPSFLINITSIFLPDAIGLDGDQDCLNASNYQTSKENCFYKSDSGPTARILIDMSDNDKFYHSLVFGQSGHLFSKDRIDNSQLKSWQKLEFHAMSFSRQQLGLSTKHTLVLDNNIE